MLRSKKMLFSKRRAHSAPLSPTFPRTIEELRSQSEAFRGALTEAKQTPPSAFGWYPHDTMASLQHLAPLLEENLPEFQRSLQCGPILDIGCGDGDLSYFFASQGFDVTAIDHPSANYNWMTGVRTLHQRLQLPVEIEEQDVDSQFVLERAPYGLVLLLGTLYHLKNPFYVLETLAKNARYCVLSTRIASITPSKTKMEKEPLAYLLDRRETNNDASNYWIFSPAGLLRLAKRAGWQVLGSSLTPSKKRPNPVDPDADSRMFLFLRSELRSSPAELRLTEGWTEVSEQQWAWTLKKFVIEAHLQEAMPPSRFRLHFVVPPVVAAASPVTIACQINGNSASKQTFKQEGDQVFEASIPASIKSAETLRLEFTVKHRFHPEPPDQRNLGIIVPFRGTIHGVSEPIGFWLD